MVDHVLQQLLTRPDEFDVLATPNLNGDYLSDALAAQVGGIGIAFAVTTRAFDLFVDQNRLRERLAGLAARVCVTAAPSRQYFPAGRVVVTGWFTGSLSFGGAPLTAPAGTRP